MACMMLTQYVKAGLGDQLGRTCIYVEQQLQLHSLSAIVSRLSLAGSYAQADQQVHLHVHVTMWVSGLNAALQAEHHHLLSLQIPSQ